MQHSDIIIITYYVNNSFAKPLTTFIVIKRFVHLFLKHLIDSE